MSEFQKLPQDIFSQDSPSGPEPAPVSEKIQKSPAPKNSLVFFILLIFVGFLAAGLLFFIFSRVLMKKGTDSGSKSAGSTAAAAVNSTVVEVIEAKSTVDNEELQQADAVDDRPLPSFVLTGLVYSADNNGLALINNKIVRQGSSVEGARLEKVEPNSVTLNFYGKTIVLRRR